MNIENVEKTMRVPHFCGGGQIEWIEKPVPQPGPGELLVKVKANALCGSERGQFYQGSPATPGHEAAGVVVVAGPGTCTAPGTPGVIFLMDFCGECRSCRRGATNQCLNKRADMGFTHDGGYGAYELIHENIFFPIDADLSLTDATLLLDIVGTGSHAIRRAQLIHGDIESLWVAGAGPIGLGILAMAKILLGRDVPVWISDVVPYRLELAERLGGLPLDVRSQQPDQLKVDAAIDSSGKAAARLACLTALNKRGVLACVGHGEGLAFDVSPQLIAPERAVLGSEYFTYGEFTENYWLMRENLTDLQTIITHRYPVEQIREAFEVFFQGNTGKVVIEQ